MRSLTTHTGSHVILGTHKFRLTNYINWITISNMKLKDKNIALDLKNRLTREIDIIELRAFGSRVSETNDEYSDLDIYIQVPSLTRELKKRILEISWEVGFENNVVISTLIFSRNEMTNTPVKSSPIVKNIYNYGIAI